jgi:Ca-activated chloride channel family protein
MKTIASIFILCLITATSFADTGEVDAQYFHPAANLYIQGDSAGASNLVVKGLSLYPDDGKLKRLKELLEQQQQQDQDQQDQNDQQQNQDQDQQQDQNQENEQEQPQPEENQEQEQQPPEPQSAEEMTEDEAKQLLDAMRQEEQNKRMQLHPVHGAPVKVDKDW